MTMMASESIHAPAELHGGADIIPTNPGISDDVLPEHLWQFVPFSARQLAFISHLKRITNPDVWPSEEAMRKVRYADEHTICIQGIIHTCRNTTLSQS